MAMPPQFQKNAKKKHAPKGAPKKDSKDPKGAPFDAIPSGPMKGKNPNDLNKGKSAKRVALLAQLKKGK